VDTDNKAQSYRVQKRKLIASRLIASQAVASEFIITGTFLAVTLAQFVLDSADANVYRRTILPTPPGGIATGCDPCVCDLNGKVVGQTSRETGGCAAREFGRLDTSHGRANDITTGIAGSDTKLFIPGLCRVPAQCVDDGVSNATNIIRNATGDVHWEQPQYIVWRTCSAKDIASDACDPEGDLARDAVIAFALVFVAQLAAILLGKIAIAAKVRWAVRRSNRKRVVAAFDPRIARRAERFLERMQSQGIQPQQTASDSSKLAARARFKRAGVLAKVSIRLKKAAEGVETVELVMLEMTEAVNAHWKRAWWYSLAASVIVLGCMFTVSGMVLSMQIRHTS
jgi:hypothetical protein